MARFSFRREPAAEAPPRLVISDPQDEAPASAASGAAPKAEAPGAPPAAKLNLALDDEPADIGPVATDTMLDMRLRLHSKLIEEIDLSKLEKLDEGEMRRQVRRLVADFAKTERLALNSGELDELGASVFDEMVGLGPIEPLLKDDSIADILINGPFQVYVERRGELEIAPVRFRDNEHLLRIVNRIVAGVGRRVDESSPLVDARLPDGSRVNAAIGPVAIDGAAVSIRKFSKKP
ncbi:MAG TPA: ATPase, T2SS/T4P/T4SS family, partial [Caulobacteraceae bacterium]|nr:ATPase, T2SS/T4P/T4SS family [Caulobacteraceae bacterium]